MLHTTPVQVQDYSVPQFIQIPSHIPEADILLSAGEGVSVIDCRTERVVYSAILKSFSVVLPNSVAWEFLGMDGSITEGRQGRAKFFRHLEVKLLVPIVLLNSKGGKFRAKFRFYVPENFRVERVKELKVTNHGMGLLQN